MDVFWMRDLGEQQLLSSAPLYLTKHGDGWFRATQNDTIAISAFESGHAANRIA